MPSNTKYPSPNDWTHATKRQQERAARSFAQLALRKMPVYDGPLVVGDDEEVQLQSPIDAAKRALVLWAVALKGDGAPTDLALEIVEKTNVWDAVSEKEYAFLTDRDPDPECCQELKWRLEAIWVLLWALCQVEELPWPYTICNMQIMHQIMYAAEQDPDFIKDARLRDKSELLDAQDLTLRIRWSIRNTILHSEDQMLPEALDWSEPGEMIHWSKSESPSVTHERHHTLNWLVRFMETGNNWDRVETHT